MQFSSVVDARLQVGAKPFATFFSFFSARFSFIVFAGFFFCSFFLSRPLLMSVSFVVGDRSVVRGAHASMAHGVDAGRSRIRARAKETVQ
jgi:hypothetical protein